MAHLNTAVEGQCQFCGEQEDIELLFWGVVECKVFLFALGFV